MEEPTSAHREPISPCAPAAERETSQAPPDASAARSRRSGALPDWARFLIKLGLVAGLLALSFTLVLGVYVQRGERMHPYAQDGDLLIYFRLEAPQVDDLVVYRRPDTGALALSRVVAVGRNSVNVTASGTLLVNGMIPAERVFYPTEPIAGSTLVFPCEMEDGTVFLLDDYRTQGEDSRIFGPLDQEAVLGKVVYLFRRRGF